MKRNIMKEAHKMTKEIVEKYGDVDYKTQLGLCLSFLAQEGEEEMVELKGSEKQIKWAKNIRKEMEEILIEAKENRLASKATEKKYNKRSENWKEKNNIKDLEDYKNYLSKKIDSSIEELLSNDKAGWYINNFSCVTSYNYDKWVRVQDFAEALENLEGENKKIFQAWATVNKYQEILRKKSALDF